MNITAGDAGGASDTRDHWQSIYVAKEPGDVSWYEPVPRTSLKVIEKHVGHDGSIIDVGAGASSLVDYLIADGYADVTVLDVSDAALENTRRRLETSSVGPAYVVADLTRWKPGRTFDLWHDRAVFHFMTDARMQAAYAGAMADAVNPGGHAMVATFSVDGPEQCSGLTVVRHDEASLAARFVADFTLVESWRSTHTTPWHAEQSFVWVVLQRRS